MAALEKAEVHRPGKNFRLLPQAAIFQFRLIFRVTNKTERIL
jgi:hypothetical protein